LNKLITDTSAVIVLTADRSFKHCQTFASCYRANDTKRDW